MTEKSEQILVADPPTHFRWGATLVIALMRKGRCFVANLGDSRAYRLRKGRMMQLTRDHSVVSELIEKGRIEPEEAANKAGGHERNRLAPRDRVISNRCLEFP